MRRVRAWRSWLAVVVVVLGTGLLTPSAVGGTPIDAAGTALAVAATDQAVDEGADPLCYRSVMSVYFKEYNDGRYGQYVRDVCARLNETVLEAARQREMEPQAADAFVQCFRAGAYGRPGAYDFDTIIAVCLSQAASAQDIPGGGGTSQPVGSSGLPAEPPVTLSGPSDDTEWIDDQVHGLTDGLPREGAVPIIGGAYKGCLRARLAQAVTPDGQKTMSRDQVKIDCLNFVAALIEPSGCDAQAWELIRPRVLSYRSAEGPADASAYRPGAIEDPECLDALSDEDRLWAIRYTDSVIRSLVQAGGLSPEDAARRRREVLRCLNAQLAAGVDGIEAGTFCSDQTWLNAGLAPKTLAPAGTQQASNPPPPPPNPPAQSTSGAFTMKGRIDQRFSWDCWVQSVVEGVGGLDLRLEPNPSDPRYSWVHGSVSGRGEGGASGLNCPGRPGILVVAYSYTGELPNQVSFVDMQSDKLEFSVSVKVSYSETYERCSGPCPAPKRSQTDLGMDFKGTWNAAKSEANGTFGNRYLRGTWNAVR
jgi:hypothetical protein